MECHNESGAIQSLLDPTQTVKEQWVKITEEDVREIDGDLVKFRSVIEKHYGTAQGEGQRLDEPTSFPLVRELR